jgi:hypothetical protein
MIRTLTAFTEEIDDIDAAVSEILEQLDLEKNLLKNSAGILHCCGDFLESGVVKALCGRLPFDTVGSTTMSVSAPSFMSQLGLCLMVLTSDSVSFTAGVSGPVSDNAEPPVTELYNRIVAPLPEKPALLMPFIPFSFDVAGDEFIEQIDALSGGIPAFGTLSISNEPDYSKTFTIYNGQGYPASLALLALSGDLKPSFLSVSVHEENILKQKGVVTGASRNILQSANNMPAVTYLESLGFLKKGGDVSALASIPLVVYLKDGSTLIRAAIASRGTEEVVLCGAVPVDSTIALAPMSVEDVVNSTGSGIRDALAQAGDRSLLMYSCAARTWTLGMQAMAEHEKAEECIAGKAPYCFAYSGGEIFPAFLENGSVVNHLQNDSLIICIL